MNMAWKKLREVWIERLSHYRGVLAILALGILLLMLPTGENTQEKAAVPPNESFELEKFEQKLGSILSDIRGVGTARVVLTLDSGSRQILAQDQEQDSGGGRSATTVTVGGSSGIQDVVPLQTISPRFRGALVVCAGGEDPSVRLALTRAVSALTGLGADQISICQSNS